MELPLEVWALVLQWLGERDVLSAARSCRRLREASAVRLSSLCVGATTTTTSSSTSSTSMSSCGSSRTLLRAVASVARLTLRSALLDASHVPFVRDALAALQQCPLLHRLALHNLWRRHRDLTPMQDVGAFPALAWLDLRNSVVHCDESLLLSCLRPTLVGLRLGILRESEHFGELFRAETSSRFEAPRRLTVAKILAACPKLTLLDLNCIRTSELDISSEYEDTGKHLESLTMSYGRTVNASANRLLSKLHSLNLRACVAFSASAFAQPLPNLTRVNISCLTLEVDTLRMLLQNAPRLSEIDLCYSHGLCETPEALQVLEHFLVEHPFQVTMLGMGGFQHLNNCTLGSLLSRCSTSLTHLGIGGCPLLEHTVLDILPASLRALEAHRSPFTEPQWRAALPRLPNLKALSVPDSPYLSRAFITALHRVYSEPFDDTE